MERIWNSLKRDMFRTVWKSLDAMEAATTRVLGDSWLTRAVSMFMDLRQAAFLN